MHIRKANTTDVEALKLLAKEIIDTYRSFYGDSIIDDYINSGSADALIIDNLANMLVSDEEGQLTGFVYADKT